MIRLVLSDIDGTLLPFGKTVIDERTKTAIDGLRAQGIDFSPASGRPTTDIGLAFRDEGAAATCVACDGMVAVAHGEIAYEQWLPKDEIAIIAQALSTVEHMVIGIGFNKIDDPRHSIGWHAVNATESGMANLEANHNKYGMIIPVLPEVPSHRIYVSCIFSLQDDSMYDELEELVSTLTPNIHLLRSAPGVYDVCLKTESKTKGAMALLDALGLKHDEVLVLGDSTNDISMFEQFDYSFCVETGHSAAREAARWLMPRPDEGGAAQLMEELARQGGNLEATLNALGY